MRPVVVEGTTEVPYGGGGGGAPVTVVVGEVTKPPIKTEVLNEVLPSKLLPRVEAVPIEVVPIERSPKLPNVFLRMAIIYPSISKNRTRM